MSETDLDITRLAAYIQQTLPQYPPLQAAKKFSDGQSNPTYLLTLGEQHLVLRRKPFGTLLKSAHAVDREFRVISALASTDVPVPRALALCTDDAVIGSWFYLMSYVPGRVFWDPALPDLAPTERTAIYDAMNRVLADLCNVDVAAVGLSDYGRPGNYFARQVARWSQQYQASETETIPAMNQLMQWLPEHLPQDAERACLVHGDFRIDNMIFHPTEPKVLAVLDWELSTLGHPLADLSYQCAFWQFPNRGVVSGLAGVDRDALGLPSDPSYIQHFLQRTRQSEISNWAFYMAFHCFRFAAITQGVQKRHLSGNASSERAREVGAMTAQVAQLGAQWLQGK